MDKLTKEYVEMLTGLENASERFWTLDGCIKKGKKKPGCNSA